MNNLQKMGGIAALIEAATYLVGIVIASGLLIINDLKEAESHLIIRQLPNSPIASFSK